MTEQIKSPGLGPLHKSLTQEEREASLARFQRAADEGRALFNQQVKMMEEHPELLDLRQGRVSLLVPLGPAGGEPMTPRPTEDRTPENLALFGDPGLAAEGSISTDRLAAAKADIAALHLAAEARIYDLVRTCRRLTGDHQTDFREISHALDFIEEVEERFGRSDATDKATVVLCNAGGEVWMRHLTGHGPPYSTAEHNQKDAIREDIDYGRRQREFVRRDDDDDD